MSPAFVDPGRSPSGLRQPDGPSSRLLAPRSRLLISYFQSGWAFFIPYLAAYLLYAWLTWPVNPTSALGLPSNGLPPSFFRPPCLLHVYWTLHVMHVALGLIATAAWCKRQSGSANEMLFFAGALVLLALFFSLPGVYWEFPGDVWEHYLRINDWSHFADIRSNSGWQKSAYFLVYSFAELLPAARQFFWLDFYYTSMCLLVCWQYYRLAREAGLNHGPAFVFVLLQALLFGNSVFSFYRYYGLASTAPAHLCALALIRLGLRTSTALCQGRLWNGLVKHVLSAGACALLLLIQMAFNHPQALGLALLGLIAVAIWQLGEWKRASLLWLAVAVLLASVAVASWWPVSPVLRDTYRSTGWMTPWYGFNLLAPESPAGQRGVQILGAFGLVNLAAGTWLLRRNHLAGWLTVTPVLALLCPLFAIPFATLLSKTSVDYIVVSSRMLLGIPVGLALVVFYQEMNHRLAPSLANNFCRRFFSPFPVLICSLVALLAIPANAPYYNRFWQALVKTPADLALHQAVVDFSRPELAWFKKSEAPHFVTTDGLGFSAHAIGFRNVTFDRRLINYPRLHTPSAAADKRFGFLTGPQSHETVIFVPSPFEMYSPLSFAGFLSGHWLPQEVALEHTAGPETTALALRLGADQIAGTDGAYYFIGR